MERLTAFDGEFWVHKNFPPVEEDRIDEFIDCVKELAARLAAYEDTGLEPEEIEIQSIALAQCKPYMDTLCDEQGKVIVNPVRLRELAQADKEGRCVVLPTKDDIMNTRCCVSCIHFQNLDWCGECVGNSKWEPCKAALRREQE